MLDDILKEVKGIVADVIGKSTDIPVEAKDQAMKVSSDAILKGLTDNSQELPSLFLGNGSGKGVMDSIQGFVVDSLVEKVGLNADIAKSLVSSMLPLVVRSLSGKVNSNGGNKFSIETIVDTLSGNGSGGGKGLGSVLGAFGKLLD